MNTHDAGLEVLRDQLRRAERILELTKQEVGHNPVQYRLFSQGIIDLIESLRADLDAYPGVAPARLAQTVHAQDQAAMPEPARP